MNNAETILSELDGRLNKAIELTVYRRAAIALGFKEAPEEYFKSNDVDIVLWLRQDVELQETNFWDAVNDLNSKFQEQGLYLTHLFTGGATDPHASLEAASADSRAVAKA